MFDLVLLVLLVCVGLRSGFSVRKLRRELADVRVDFANYRDQHRSVVSDVARLFKAVKDLGEKG